MCFMNILGFFVDVKVNEVCSSVYIVLEEYENVGI